MAARTKKRSYFLLSDSSDSECSIPVNRKKQLKQITVGRLNLKQFCDHSTDEDDNSGPKFVNRKDNSVVCTATKDERAKFTSRNKENACPVMESKRKYNERVRNFRRKYDSDEDFYDSSASSDGGKEKFLKLSNSREDSDGKNKVKVMGSSQKIDNGTSANKHDASNSVVTSNPLKQNKQENKKDQEAVTNMRHHIMKMTEELKYILSKFKLKVNHLQLRCVQDETVMGQDGKGIMYIYNSMINKLKKELTVQQQISMGPYHRCGETAAHSQSSSEIFSANYKRSKVTKISKPDVKNNVNKQPLEANCTSAVTVEKNNNTTLISDQSLTSLLRKLKEIDVVKTSSRISEAASISTVRSEPNLEVLDRAYKKMIERHQDTSKQDSLSNGHVKEKGLLQNYDSDVNSTCSTIAFYPRRNGNVQKNNYQGDLIHAGANKDVLSSDVSNREISKSPISDVSSVDGEVSDEIPLTNLYTSYSKDTVITSSNEIRNFMSRSKDHIPVKGKTVLTSSNSENIKPKQRSEFVVPDINNLNIKYLSHRVVISNRADSVPEGEPTEQNQYDTRSDEKLRMNCQVMIEKFRVRR